MYQVDFYTTDRGSSPPWEFIKNVNVRASRKILRHIQHIKIYGLTLDNKYLRKLSGTSLWESRILGKDNIRIICGSLSNKTIVVVNIFTKKSNKTPSNELNVSVNRFVELTNISKKI